MSNRSRSLTAELLALKDASGLINARTAVDWARANKDSALHAELEWDDQAAGEEYRVIQVRQLVIVHVRDENNDRRLVSLTVDRSNGGGYRDAADVARLPNLRQMLLDDALEELQRIQRKYQHLTELVEVWEAATKVETSLRREQPQRKRRGAA